MPTQPIRLYLPDARPDGYTESEPDWFSAEVSATTITQLQNIDDTQSWPENIANIATAATGRHRPRTKDIVTLYRDNNAFTRTWDGFHWISVEPFLDGKHIYYESLLANTIEGDITADRVQAEAVETPLLLFNSFTGDKWPTNSLDGEIAVLDEAIINQSVQVGPGNIEFDNLSAAIIAPVSVSRNYSIPSIRDTRVNPSANLVMLEGAGDSIHFTRNSLNEEIRIHIQPIYTFRGDNGTSPFSGGTARAYLNRAAGVTVNIRVGARERIHTAIGTLTFEHTFPRGLVSPFNDSYQYQPQSILVPLAESPIGETRQVFIYAEARTRRQLNRNGLYYFYQIGAKFSHSVSLTAILQEARPFG